MRQRFIQSFSTSGDVQTAVDNKELGKPYVSYVEDGKYIDWNSKSVTPSLSGEPLTFEIINASTITWKRGESIWQAPSCTIEYSINDGPWSSITSTLEGVSFPVNNGDKVKFRGNNNKYTAGLANTVGNTLLVNGTFKLYGNMASLINSTGYTSVSHIEGLSQFFRGNTGLTEVTEIAFGINSDSFGTGALTELFSTCSSLNYIKCLLNIANSNITSGWLKNVSSTGTFVKHPDATWSSGTSGIPSGWTIKDAEI